MKDDISSDKPRTSSGWVRKLAIGLAGLLALLVVLYFVVSSSAFLKGVILPRVGKSLNSEITVGDASISPFSQVTLRNLKVQPVGTEPLLTAAEVRVRYSLVSILRGNYAVDELTLASPIVQIVKEASGTSNLDPLTKGQEATPGSTSSSGPLRLAIRNVSLKDAVLRKVDKAKDGSVKTVELSPVNLTLDRLENGQSGKFTLATSLKLDNRVPQGKPGTNDLMEGKVNGSFEFKLDQKLLPQTVTGNADVAFFRAEGAYGDLTGLGGVLQVEVTPTEVRQLAVRFERSGQSLGQVQASGPLDLTKSEGRLRLEVLSIDRQVLNLFGAGRGWDFTNSKLSATNSLDIARQGEVVGAKGHVVGRQISIRQQGQSIPEMDVDIEYEASVNLNDRAAVISKLTILGQQHQQDLLHASLDRPMTLTWATTARGFADSTFQLALTQLNLKDWQAVLGTNAPSGRLDLQLSVLSKEDGKNLTTKASGTIQDFAAQFGTNRIDQAQVSLGLESELQNFKTVNVKQFQLEVQQRNQPFVKANGSAHSDLSTPDFNLQATAEAALPALLRLFPSPPLAASNGVVRLSAAVTQKNRKNTLTGTLFLGDFTGTYGAYSFQDYQAALEYNLDVEQPVVQIHSATLSLRNGYSSGGSVGLTGEMDLDKRSAQLTFKLVGLNENALGPLLMPFLGDKKLLSITLNGSGLTTYDPKGEASLKSDLSVTNWVVAISQPQFASPNLSAEIQIDGSVRQQIVDLRQFLLKLTPTARARNELQVKARLDLNPTNTTPNQVTLQADSLDVTPYYEMFAGQKKQTNAPTAQRAPAPPSARQLNPSEPGPANLPLQQLTADLKIDRLYLRQLAVTNLQTTAKVNHGEITLKPFEFTLNGAPVSATAVVNLGVPGYTYDVSCKADRVPIEPLSNSFTTNAPGQYKGDLIAQAQLKGAGITDVNLKKNLTGSFSLNLTNMNYEIVGQKTKRLLEPIALVLRVPELTQTPLNWVVAKADIGKGQIDLQQFTVQSQAFYAESRGVVPMADVLTNSPLNLPVSLSLRRSLAERANLVAANTPTNAIYAQLPTFVTLAGTLGDPKTEINKLVISGLLARSIAGLAPVGGKAGTILQGLGGMLSGQPSAPVSTNAPVATNASPAANIVQGIGDLLNQPKKDRTATNPPAASTNKPAKVKAVDLLKLLPDKK